MKGAVARHIWAIPFEIAMVCGAVATFSQGNWKHFAASLFTLAVSFLPIPFERWFRVMLPAWVQASYVAFVFVSFFSGEVLRMYGRIWVWDDIMHFLSGFLVGIGVMLWLVMLGRRVKKFHVPVWFGALFILLTSMGVATAWELVEFGSDEIFGTFTQGADLFDTMLDLVYQTTSGLVMAALWVAHCHWGKVPLMSFLIRQFERLNR